MNPSSDDDDLDDHQSAGFASKRPLLDAPDPPLEVTFTPRWKDRIRELVIHPSLSSVSVTLKRLTPLERQYMVLVENKKTDELRKFLEQNVIDVNCKDMHGFTAIQRAARNEDYKTLRLLLDHPNTYIYDDILYAIQMGNTEIVAMILDGIRSRGLPEDVGFEDSAEFSKDITPLVLACHENDLGMVKLLLEREHRLEKPHPPGCCCQMTPLCRYVLPKILCCMNGEKGFEKSHEKVDVVFTMQSRFNAFKAYASPAYLSLTQKDVIGTSFAICKELFQCSQKEPELTHQYIELLINLRDFMCQLMDECGETEEVELILNHREKQDKDIPVDAVFPRLHRGLMCKQRDFVAHENCQAVLTQHYLGDWEDWSRMAGHAQALKVMFNLVALWVYVPVHIFLPSSILPGLHGGLKPPIFRHILAVLFYLLFLVLLFIQTVAEKEHNYRGQPRTGLEVFILIYVLGYAVELVQRGLKYRAAFFTGSWWNYYDALNIILYFVTFLFWEIAYQRAKDLPELDRMEWDGDEPALIAEALFAVSTVFAYGKLLQIFRVHRKIGPLLISIGKIANDVSVFVVIFLCFMVSFSTGLSLLYESYAGQVQVKEDGSHSEMKGSFTSFAASMDALFWALFGQTSSDAASVVISNKLPNGTIIPSQHMKTHVFTERTGMFLFGVFEVIAVLVGLNILVGVAANSFQKVADNSDVEWKCNRARIWLSYFGDRIHLPPPLNLIPTFETILRFANRILNKDARDHNIIKRRSDAAAYSELQGRLIKSVFGKLERKKYVEKRKKKCKCECKCGKTAKPEDVG